MEERLDHLARVMERGFETLADLQRETNERLDATNERLDATNGRLDALAYEVKELKTEVTDLKVEVRSLGGRFDNFVTGVHRQEHDQLRGRLDRIERHLGWG